MSPSTLSTSTSATPSSALPLRWLLQRLIAEGRVPRETVAISVAANVHLSSHSSEFLTLQTPDSKTLRLFCKHGAPSDESWLAYGHRGGLPYESNVYRHLLSHLPLSIARFYGAFHHATQHEDYLVIEQLDDAIRVYTWDDPQALPKAAHWIGSLHALAEPRLAARELKFLHAYDKDYYIGWSRRTLEFSRLRSLQPSWLRRLCDRYEALIELLLSATPTIIHGEYYPKNILVRDGQIYPVDWESTAIAAGEVDLASLTEGWPAQVEARCAQAYCKARWGGTPAREFFEILAAGKLYWRFRWLGNSFEWSAAEEYARLIEELHDFAQESALL